MGCAGCSYFPIPCRRKEKKKEEELTLIPKQPYFISAVFAFGTATAKDIQTVLITRFFAGAFGSGPISITGGAIVDIWRPPQLGVPMVCYGITIAAAPTLGPIIGGAFIADGSGWRWTQYLTGILMAIQFVLDALFLDESHADIILTRKAQQLRRSTGNWVLHSKVRRPRSVLCRITDEALDLLTAATNYYSGKSPARPLAASAPLFLSVLSSCSSTLYVYS